MKRTRVMYIQILILVCASIVVYLQYTRIKSLEDEIEATSRAILAKRARTHHLLDEHVEKKETTRKNSIVNTKKEIEKVDLLEKSQPFSSNEELGSKEEEEVRGERNEGNEAENSERKLDENEDENENENNEENNEEEGKEGKGGKQEIEEETEEESSEFNPEKFCGCSFENDAWKKETFQFLHIPKCGTSFIMTLRNYLDACEEKDYTCKHQSESADDQCQQHLRTCDGHAPLRLKKHPPNVAVIFRDPAKRVISAFHHGKHAVGFEGSDQVRESTKTVEEFVSLDGIANCQIKMVIGKRCAANYTITESDFERAKDIVANYISFIGITDHFSTSICLFHKAFGGVPRPLQFGNVRLGKYKHSDVEPELQAFLEEKESWDYKLYNFALGIFNERLEKYGVPLRN